MKLLRPSSISSTHLFIIDHAKRSGKIAQYHITIVLRLFFSFDVQTAFSITAKPMPQFNFHTKQSITTKTIIFSILLLIIVIISV